MYEVKITKVRNERKFRVKLFRDGNAVAEYIYPTRKLAVLKANDLYFHALGV